MQNFDHNIVFLEKRQFFAENRQKSQTNVIITSTPGLKNIIESIYFSQEHTMKMHMKLWHCNS
jgi:hypothetical protein